MLYFEKIAAAVGAPPPNPPLASGGWGLCPQITELLLPFELRVSF